MASNSEEDFIEMFKKLQEESGESIEISGGLVTCKSKKMVFVCGEEMFNNAMKKAVKDMFKDGK